MASRTAEASADIVRGWFNATIGTVVLYGAQLIMRGFVLSQMWNWFVSSALSTPKLSIGEAIGLICVFSFLTLYFQRDSNLKGAGVGLALSAMALAYAAVIHYVFGVG